MLPQVIDLSTKVEPLEGQKVIVSAIQQEAIGLTEKSLTKTKEEQSQRLAKSGNRLIKLGKFQEAVITTRIIRTQARTMLTAVEITDFPVTDLIVLSKQTKDLPEKKEVKNRIKKNMRQAEQKEKRM